MGEEREVVAGNVVDDDAVDVIALEEDESFIVLFEGEIIVVVVVVEREIGFEEGTDVKGLDDTKGGEGGEIIIPSKSCC